MVRLGDVCTFFSGTGFPNKFQGNRNGKYPFYKVGDISKNVLFGTQELKYCENYVDDNVVKEIHGTILPPQTIVFAKIGEALRLNRRAITENYCLIDNNVMGIHTNNNNLNTRYLYYFMCSIDLQSYCESTTIPSVRKSRIAEIEIPLPSLEEQRHIAAVLDKVSNLIAKRRQQLDKLDEMVKARFVEMFGEPGEDKNNWGINCLGDVCEINPKKSLDKRLVNDFIVSFIPMPAVTENGEIDPSESKTYDEVRTGFTYFVENDVLFAKITPCMENGKGAIAKGLYNGVGFGSTEFHVLRPIKDKTTAPWLYVLTSLPKFRLDAADNMTGSAGQRRVPASFLTTYKVAAPPIELQEQFSTLYNQISKSKLTIQRSCDKLEVLKKALMQEYFG